MGQEEHHQLKMSFTKKKIVRRGAGGGGVKEEYRYGYIPFKSQPYDILFLPYSFLLFLEGSVMEKSWIRDKHSGSATL
jgi:hypothetical protein